MMSLRVSLFAHWAMSVASLSQSEFVGLMANATDDDCTQDGQCGNGGTPCCSGSSHKTLACGWDACEPICEAVVGEMIKALPDNEGACVKIIAEGASLCEIVGLGPEDPFADICAATVTIGCPIVAAMLLNGVPDAATACGEIGICANSGQRCGCLADGQCNEGADGCCSGNSHFTMACPGMQRCGEKNPSTSYKTITPASNTGLCLDLPGEDTTPGTPLWLWECNGGESQQWAFDNWQIRFGADESKCVDAGDMSDGNQLILWDCNDQPQQAWGYDDDAKRVYLANTAMCADFYADNAWNGQAFHIWDCNGLENQEWGIWDVGLAGVSSSIVAV